MVSAMESSNESVRATVVDWISKDALVLLGAGGVMAKIGRASELDRDEVNSNKDVLKPIIQHIGHLAGNRLSC